MENRYKISGPDVIFEQQGTEVLVINLSNGCYYSLRGFSAYLWSALTFGANLSELISELQHVGIEVSPEKKGEIKVLIGKLCNESLLIVDQGLESFSPEFLQLPFSDFSISDVNFQKYEDLKSLLLVDPIHEIRLRDVSDAE